VRPDTLVVLNLDPQTGSCRMLAIPRDSRVDLPGYGASKVNHALAVGGVPYQMLVTQNLLGIPFDHYGLVDFAGVEDLVEALGGITVVNERAFSYGGHTFSKGELRLSGEETLAYVRFRGDEEGDFGRQERQQLVVRSMLTAGADLDVVTAIPQLLNAVEDHIRTDADPTTLIDFGRDFHSSCTAETLDAKRISGEVRTLHDVLLDEPLSFVVLAEAEVAAKVNWLLTGEEPHTPPPNATPDATPAATPVGTPVALGQTTVVKRRRRPERSSGE
jgi:LCP family protein required for cell wall assembly